MDEYPKIIAGPLGPMTVNSFQEEAAIFEGRAVVRVVRSAQGDTIELVSYSGQAKTRTKKKVN